MCRGHLVSVAHSALDGGTESMKTLIRWGRPHHEDIATWVQYDCLLLRPLIPDQLYSVVICDAKRTVPLWIVVFGYLSYVLRGIETVWRRLMIVCVRYVFIMYLPLIIGERPFHCPSFCCSYFDTANSFYRCFDVFGWHHVMLQIVGNAIGACIVYDHDEGVAIVLVKHLCGL